MKTLKGLSKDHLLLMAHLQHQCHTLAYSDNEQELNRSYWKCENEQGEFQYDDGTGNLLAIKWNPKNLSLTVFDHESDRSHFDPQFKVFDEGEKPCDIPDFFFDDFPKEYLPILSECAQLLARTGWPNVTTTLWGGCDQQLYLPEPFTDAEEHGLWMLDNYFLNVEDALTKGGKSSSWRELFGLSDEQVQNLMNFRT